jgi:hypothetical protein
MRSSSVLYLCGCAVHQQQQASSEAELPQAAIEQVSAQRRASHVDVCWQHSSDSWESSCASNELADDAHNCYIWGVPAVQCGGH